MIVCANCSHQNPGGAIQCEACYTPLPTLAGCPSCGASVQSDASFCGQCGFDLRAIAHSASSLGASQAAEETVKTRPAVTPPLLQMPGLTGEVPEGVSKEVPEEASKESPEAVPEPTAESAMPDLIQPDPLVTPDPIQIQSPGVVPEPTPSLEAPDPSEATVSAVVPEPPANPPLAEPATAEPPSAVVPAPTPTAAVAPVAAPEGATRIQINAAKIFHVQTQTTIELPPDLTIIHLGKPNDRVPPVIDVSGFPHSEIVSRVHASIRVEGDVYYLEDASSSNGTYVNNLPLPPGNRHRLRAGDRFALGKGDKVSFLFQQS
ncbi:MAG: FHA domain-containing protein [Cyanobacteria bacterium P01_C01_bin.73]